MAESSCFPENSDQALAFLYVQRNAPGDATPEVLQELYDDACRRIETRRREIEGKRFNVENLI